MKRFIDKMALIDTVLKKRYSQASINLILNQPEIEAVPIEWIQKWKWQESNDSYNRLTIDSLIRDWEKENGE